MSGLRRSLRSAARSASSTSTVAASQDDDDNQPIVATVPSTGPTDSQLTSQVKETQEMDEDFSSDNDEGDEGYGHLHRLVFQGMMSAGYLDAKGVRKLFQEAGKFLKCKVPVTGKDIYAFIRKINEKIKNQDMVIRSASCELTGDKYYILLFTNENPMMKLQKYFTKVELDLFQKILDSLLRKHANFAISKIDCINMVAELDSRAFTKVNGENLVNKMIKMMYFTKVYKTADKDEEDGDYDITLGFRTIREFESIFREVYGDIFGNCILCKMILLNGLQCPQCPAVIHRACLKKYLEKCNTCLSSSCGCLWENENVLLTRTRDASGDEPLFPQTPSQTEELSQSGGLASEDDDVDMSVLEPVALSSRTETGSGSKKRKQSEKVPTKSQPSRASKRRIRVVSPSNSD